MQLWQYVITTDAGKAPNYDAPAATLAICKPQIRKRAEIGDLVVAYAGSGLRRNLHAVVWGGIVSGKMTFSEYWDAPDFQGKKPGACCHPDNIYRPVGNSFVQVQNCSHDPSQKARDLSCLHVLVFERFWRIGPDKEPPSIIGSRLEMTARRGHRRSPVTADELAVWIAWLGKHSIPADRGGGPDGICSRSRQMKRKRKEAHPVC